MIGGHDGQGPSTTTANRVPPLITFIFRDVQPEGQRLLAPFLTTMDLRHMSESCKDLVPYHLHLSRVKLVPHPSRGPGIKEALMRLMKGQVGKGVQYLRVDDTKLLVLVDRMSVLGCLEGLKKLDLQKMRLGGDAYAAACVGRVLSGGRVRDLEELNLQQAYEFRGAADFRAIMEALADGACPQLRRLNLSGAYGLRSDVVARALESGNLRRLEMLNMRGTRMAGGEDGLEAIGRALEMGCCPELRKLMVMELPTMVGYQALARALVSGACEKLECLVLSVGPHDRGVVPILEAVAAGSTQHLKQLCIPWFITPAGAGSLGPSVGTALVHALSSGHCQGLEYLDLSCGMGNPAVSLPVMQAIGEYAWPNLQHLELRASDMREDHVRVLVEAINKGTLPSLGRVSLFEAPSKVAINAVQVVGLDLGLGRQVKWGVTALSETAAAMARALASVKGLDLMSVKFEGPMGDQAMADVIRALASGPGHGQLRYLTVKKAGMGGKAGQALLQALRMTAWPNLQILDIGENLLLGDGVVGMGLAEALEGGGWGMGDNADGTGVWYGGGWW